MILITRKFCCLWDFVVRDIKITLYLESPRKINFNLVRDLLNKVNFPKKWVLTINNNIVIYLDLWQKSIKSTFPLQNINIITSFTQINSFFCCFFWKVLNNSTGFITPVLKNWRIRMKNPGGCSPANEKISLVWN